MFKSIVSFVMALVFVSVSIFGLEFGNVFEAKAAQPTAVQEAVKPQDDSDDFNILGFCWNDEDKVWYSAHNAWQRNFGYNRFYDFAAQFLLLYYDTCRITFTYGDRDWLVQLWKGQYGLILVGAEIGVYSKEKGAPLRHYECANDEDLFSIGYVLYSYDDVLFVRTYQKTWWLTGFRFGRIDKFSDRSQLSIKARITLKDSGMKDEFVKALKRFGVGFKEGNGQDKDTFYVLGNDVYLMWNTDRNRTS